MQFEINAKKRVQQGSGASRRLRRASKVPGIVYGGAAEPVPVEIDHNEILLALRKESFQSSIITLKLEGTIQSVLLRDVQMHPYKSLVLHVDFQHVDAGRVIHQKVPLHFINADIAPGVKLGGGMVSHVMNDIEVSCLPKDLPAFVEVDLKDMEAGQTLSVSQLAFPKGVTPVSHSEEDPVVVTIIVKKAAATEETEEGGESKNEDAAAPTA